MSVVHVDFLGERAEREIARAVAAGVQQTPDGAAALTELRELLAERERIVAEQQRRSEALRRALGEVAKAVEDFVQRALGRK